MGVDRTIDLNCTTWISNCFPPRFPWIDSLYFCTRVKNGRKTDSGRTIGSKVNYLSVFLFFSVLSLSMETRNDNRKINTIANLANRGSIEVEKEKKEERKKKNPDETPASHLNRERIIFLITRVISQSRRRNGRRKENREGWAWEKSNVVSAMIVPSSRARAFQLISGKPLFFFKFILVIPFARRDYDAASAATLQLICIDFSMQKEEDPAALRPSLFVWRQGINPPKWRDTTTNRVETRLFLATPPFNLLVPRAFSFTTLHVARGKRYNLGNLVRFSIPRSRIVSSALLNVESLSLQRPSPLFFQSWFLYLPFLFFLLNYHRFFFFVFSYYSFTTRWFRGIPESNAGNKPRLNDFAQRFSRVRAPITPYPSVILVIEATLVFVP